MNNEDEIKWVKLELNFSPEQEVLLERHAKAEGLSVNCFCLHVLLKHLSDEALTENWRTREGVIFRRNGCRSSIEGQTATTST